MTAAPDAPPAPPVDDLYKTALGDYMSAKYTLADAEFGDVIKYYPDNPLAGNAFYYQAEIAYRNGRYPEAIKSYDNVIDKYPASNKVPVSRLHKGRRSSLSSRRTQASVSFEPSSSASPTRPKPCRPAAS